ncbi:conserved hypothetical protein [Culex quinquefasciatus]|uniref:Uncharacterized protein n=1 Tax=Culex quinquefasciatus TaxID=7176 RepID=B0WWJ2_CULQU|nr:conserved hypothetical protein [Culex quinquefasciatus]|eukprot:XP_001861764.1 conserved hypothetical protein [Culex quinquefasciatus]
MSFKRSREDLTTSDPEEEPVQSLDELFSRMKTMFEKTNARIENCKSDLQSEFAVLREDMQQFKTECSNNVNKLSADLSKTRDNVSLNYERILVCGKLNDLLLSGRIYLNENLTELARSIKGSALKMKKDGKLHSVFTKDGFVQVKDRAEDEARPVHSVEQLANKPFP